MVLGGKLHRLRVVSFLVITFLHILLGELVPKSLAIRRAEQCALAIAYPMRWAYRLFYLPMRVLNGASNLVLKLMGSRQGMPKSPTRSRSCACCSLPRRRALIFR